MSIVKDIKSKVQVGDFVCLPQYTYIPLEVIKVTENGLIVSALNKNYGALQEMPVTFTGIRKLEIEDII